MSMALSPNGRYVAVKTIGAESGVGDGNIMRNDLHVFDVAGCEHKILVRYFSQVFGLPGFSWSPESNAIAYTTFGDGQGKLVLTFLNGTQKLIDAGDIDLGNEEGTPPLWSPDGKTVYCWANMSIYVA